MDPHDDFLRPFAREAAADPRGIESREALCEILAQAFESAGQMLWVHGSMLGSDRVTGESPFEHGSDAVVGLATVVQIAGELTSGAMQLLRANNLYAAAALIRQMVEVEYLAWAFSEAEEEAAVWLRSSRQERLKLWQPRHLRERADGRFRAPDYAAHCDAGGHPTPHSATLLRDHSMRQPSGIWWNDLAGHALGIWRYAVAAAKRLEVDQVALARVDTARVDTCVEVWHRDDPFHEIVARRKWHDSLWARVLERGVESGSD